jgi:hypothetical protein
MDQSRLRTVAIANAAVLVTAVLSVGQVRFEQRQDALGQGPSSSDTPSTPDGTATPAPGLSGVPRPSATTPVASPGATPRAGATNPLPQGTTAPVVTLKPGVKVPDFGLKTQGVTAKTVKLGVDYDKTGCGGANALANQFSKSVTGDPEKAVAAFRNYVNDTGGIRGRTLSTVTVDDGGLYCPERHEAAVIELVDQQKVFMDVAGLHEVSTKLAKRKIPYMGGWSTIAEQRRDGYGQFQLFQDADGDFANWASMAKHVINSAKEAPCLIHPDTADFNNLEKVLNAEMFKAGLPKYSNGKPFKDVIAYQDEPSTAQYQAQTGATRMSNNGCKQVWLIANNALADVFFTNAAASINWYPTWSWTARTALIDQQLGGSLMNSAEWQKSIGLTTRIQPGKSPYEGNCAKIYKRYYNGDGLENSAATLAACVGVLTSTEAMKRAVDLTGVLTADSLMLGVNAIRGDFWFDSHVPMTYSVPPPPLGQQHFDFTGYDLQTVAKWNSSRGDYDFPYFPSYWKVIGPNRSGAVNILAALKKTYTPPKR